MSYQQLMPLPGVCKVDSAYSNSIKGGYTQEGLSIGRITDMLGSRFVAGRAEKKGGYTPLITSLLTGVCRGSKDWRDFSQNLYCAFGTNTNLFVYLNSTTSLLDITPLRSVKIGTLTNPVTTNGTTTVSIAHTAHGLVTGDYVQLTAASAVDGVLVANTYFITRTDANNYTITVPTAATGSTSGAGGSTAYVYYRVVLASSPFATTNGSSIVVVTHSAHGALIGDTVIFTGATAINNITLNGAYIITSTTTNTYTVVATTVANASSSGGGTPNVQYEISIGNVDAGFGMGYGVGTYGSGGYGQAQASSSLVVNPRIWSIDSYGQQLLAAPYGGTIYIWDPSTYANNNGRAYPMYGAPTSISAMFVTPERFVFALGTSANYMIVQWPDQNNYNTWTSLPTNTANSRTLQIGSYIVGGGAARDGSSLVITNNCAYLFNYSGDTYIYDSTAVGRNSGLIGPLAIVAYGGNLYWMSHDEFWTWNGAVTPLPSDDIRDYVFKNLNVQQGFKFFAYADPHFKEITFYYVANGSNEISNSVTYHIDQQCWSIDTKSRTSFLDNQLFQYPISTDASGNIWNEEYGSNANGSALDSYIVFNPVAISKGDRRMDIMGFLPDFERQTGTCVLSLLTQDYPDDPQTVSSTYNLLASDQAPLIDVRDSTTFLGFKIESNVVSGDWRLGLCQADIQLAGARR
jgi:hypothetical protein